MLPLHRGYGVYRPSDSKGEERFESPRGTRSRASTKEDLSEVQDSNLTSSTHPVYYGQLYSLQSDQELQSPILEEVTFPPFLDFTTTPLEIEFRSQTPTISSDDDFPNPLNLLTPPLNNMSAPPPAAPAAVTTTKGIGSLS
jgi:hypothetical protein